jgi:hypothetical protein
MGVKPGLTTKEEHRLSVFENRLLRRLFELKRNKVTAVCKKVHDEEVYILYSSVNIVRMIK